LVPFTVGCGKGGDADGASGQTTAGGELPEGAGDRSDPSEGVGPVQDDDGMGAHTGDGADAAGDAKGEGGAETPAASPWGETRAEQCKPPPRKAIKPNARTAIRQGAQAARSGDRNAARTAFQQALSADPNAYEAHFNLGVLADRSGQANQAIDHYRKALRIQPDFERAARGMVAIHLRRGDAGEARRFAEALASQFRANLELQALFAETLVRTGRHDAAYDAARKALECDERFVPAMIAMVKASQALERKELAESVLDQALEIDAGNAELHFLKAQMLVDEDGRLRDALERYRKAIELRPDYLEARMAYGVQLLHGGNYPDALKQLQAAANLAPTLVAVHLNLGDAYRANQQWDKAREAFQKALSMEPNLPKAHFNMGLMYMTALEDYPGLDKLEALRKARQELKKYRDMMGPRLPRDDPSEGYLADLDRQIERTERMMEREAAAKQREAERAARQADEGGDAAGGEQQ
jgi:tetratricopeptide (TPR) repeat protein